MNHVLKTQLETNRSQLSLKESMFVDALMIDPDPVKAAAVAGFGNPDIDAWKLLADKRISKSLYERRQALLESVSAVHAVKQLEDLITNKTTPATTRLSAIKLALEASAHTGSKARQVADPDDDALDLQNMTDEELQALNGLIDAAKDEVKTRQGGKPAKPQPAALIQIT